MTETNHGSEPSRLTENMKQRISELEKALDASRQEAQQYRKALDTLSDHDQAQENLAQIRHFENMDRINRAIQGTNDLEKMMNDVLGAMISIFECHRAFLGYPCDPESTTLKVMLERTHPEYPGALQKGTRVPMDRDSARVQQLLLEAGRPMTFGPECDRPLTGKVPERFGLKSMIAAALHPKIDRPWLLGLQQCDAPRIWTSDEKKLFEEIGRRLTDGLTSLLTIRNLHKSEAENRAIVNAVPDLLFRVRKDGIITDYRKPDEMDLYLPPEQFLGKSMPEVLPPHVAGIANEAIEKALSEKQSASFEYELTIGNRRGDFEGRVAVLSDDEVLVVIRDITDRMQARRALEESEAKVRGILENIGIGVVLISPEMEILEMNHRMRQWFPDVDLGKRPVCYLALNNPPGKKICDDCPTQKTLADGLVHETTTRTLRDGTVRNYHVVSSPVFNAFGEATAVIEVVEDITKIKEAEEKLRQSETRFRELFNNMGAGMAIYSSPDDGRSFEFLDLNKAGLELTEKKISEVVGRRVRDVFPGIEEMGLFDIFRQVWKTGASAQLSSGLYRDDKLERWFDNYVYRLPSGELAAIFEDVTTRKKADEERERLMAAIKHVSEAIIITDTEGTIQYVNPSFEKITGYSSREALGQNPRILNSGAQEPAFYEELWATISSGKTWTGRLVNKRKDGRSYTEETSISPILDGGSVDIVNYVAIKRDITRELEIENRLSQSQRIEAIGSLAGGIAHDFNNLLFPIIGLSEMLLDDLPVESIERENVKGIHQAAQRAGELVKQILSFSRQSIQQKVPHRVQQVLKEVLKLTRSTIPSNIEIQSHIKQDCGVIMADPTQIHQIAMNLITNAYHAVEEKGGSISIHLKETALSDNEPPCPPLEPGRYIELCVSDTGHGIDPSILHRIFEPYFSTKPQGKGTGLGLSVVYGIVKEHGGDIQVASEPGAGTTFTVYIPLIEQHDGPTIRETVRPLDTGTERILLVDDEDAIVRLETKILERLGYRVTARTSSVDALKLFSENPADFDAVITDMAMPNMTGDRLAREMIAVKPDIPIIMCTGFSEKISKDRAKSSGIRGFLMKPVVKSDLAEMVRKVLDEKN